MITTTLTGPGSGLNSGYFAFPNLPIGSYRVAIDLPIGFSPTTATEYGMALDGIAVVEQVFFGHQLNQNRALYGQVYTDMNSSGQFDLDWDDPLPGIAVIISTPAGQVVATRNTASDGSFTVDPITSGEYRVTIAHNGETLTRVASVPASGAIPNVEFALPPADTLPRVLVFVDADRDGVVDPDEQRLSGISVSLADKPCSQIGSVLETKLTLSDGTVIFSALPAALLPQAAPPPGGGYLCAVITAGLANNFMPAAYSGVNVPRTTNNVTPLPVQTVGVLLAGFFWDANGNMLQDDGEPAIGGGSVTVNGINRTIPFNGSSPASFLLLPGTYSLQVTAPFNYEPTTSMPMTIILNPNASQTVSIPFRAASGISGLISGASASLVGGLTMELEKVSSGQVWHTTSSTFVGGPTSAGLFAFDNLPAGEYRLRLPQPPPGFVATSEPLINLPANTAHIENLALAPTGHVAGQMFLDANSDGQRQNGETGSNAFDVQLISLNGQVLQSITPGSDGAFILEGLKANTPYTMRLVFPNSDWFTTASPGVFTVGVQTVNIQLGAGIHPASSNTTNMSVGVGTVYYLQDGVKIAVVNARLVAYNASDQVIGEAYSSANGDFTIPFTGQGYYRFEGNPGFADTAAISPIGLVGGGGAANCDYSYAVIVQGVCTVPVDIEISPASEGNSLSSGDMQTGSAAYLVHWSAFRDDNGNQIRDANEPGLPGVTLATAAASDLSNAGGQGNLPLPDGLHSLVIIPPDGYLVAGPSARQVSLQGSGMTLPAIPLRPAGITTVSAFLDLDGDGRQGIGEAGVGGVTITLSGAGTASKQTTPDGRAMFSGLPDGSYTLNAMPPAGFSTPTATNLTVSNGGAVCVPLSPVGMVTALVYDDWDGDSVRAADELRFHQPFTLTLSNGSANLQTVTAAGLGNFPGLAPGLYTLDALQAAVAATSVTLTAGGGAGAGMAVVASGVVRGMVWLDVNGDGLRQPWESPLVGVIVSLGGTLTTVTDQYGRYVFYNVPAGDTNLSAGLPSGLQSATQNIQVEDGRGIATGLPASLNGGYHIHLPLVRR